MALILNRDGMASELLHLQSLPSLHRQRARMDAPQRRLRAGPFEFEMGLADGASACRQPFQIQ
jgi:hypothetical protein